MTNWFTRLFTPGRAGQPLPAHHSDPFAVPEIAAMSHAELADLPLVAPCAPTVQRPVEGRSRCQAGAAPRLDRVRTAAI